MSESSSKPWDRGSLWVFVAVCFYLFLISFRGVTPIWLFNQGESGMWLDEAERVLAGEVLYRDFFEFVGPGVVYFDAAVLAVLGSTSAMAMLLPIFVGGLLTTLLWRASSKLLNGGWRFVPPVAFLVIIYAQYNMGNHKWLSWLFGLAALDVLREGRGTPRAVVAGGLLGLAALCTQDMGTALAGGAILAFWPTASRAERLGLTVGGGLTGVAVLGYFVAQAGPETIWYDLFVFPATQYGEMNHGGLFGGVGFGRVPTVWHLPRVLLQWAVSVGGIAGALLLLGRAVTSGRGLNAGLGEWALVVWPGLSVILIGSLARPIEPQQLSVRASLLTLTATYLLARSPSPNTRTARLLIGGLAVAILYVALSTVAWRQLGVASYVDSRAGALWSPRPLPEIAWIEAHTEENDFIFLLPDKGGLYFLTRTRNATSFAQLQDMGYSTQAQIEQAIAELERRKPAIGIFDAERLAAGPEMVNSSLHPLWHYLEQHYRVDGIYLYRKTASAAAP